MDHDLLFTGFDKLCDMKSNYPLNAEGLLTAQSQAAFFTEVSQVFNSHENNNNHRSAPSSRAPGTRAWTLTRSA